LAAASSQGFRIVGTDRVARARRQLFLEDFTTGQRFEGEPKTISEADFTLFGELTGDRHPIHYDAEYAKTTRFGRPVVHGLHLMALTALGATDLSDCLEASMIALIEQSCRFLRPVFAGMILRSELVVTETVRTTGKDQGKLRFRVRLLDNEETVTLDGHHLYLMRCRPINGMGTCHGG
jgi:3-hydroxybutyryl-CoA dehydratase